MFKDYQKEKNKLRSIWKVKRKEFFLDFSKDKDTSFIKNFIKAVGCFKNKVIAGYNPINYETDCLNLLRYASKNGSKLALPYVNDKKIIEFREWSENQELVKDSLGILSPSSKNILVPDIIIIPLLCFNKKGVRLGMGLGIYDRNLPFFDLSAKYGLAFSGQETNHIIREDHDFLLDGVITEKKFFNFKGIKN